MASQTNSDSGARVSITPRPPESKSQRSRAWIFTINNYTELDEEAIARLDAQYYVYGYETGDSGTKHLQGYLYFKSQRTLGAIKKKLYRAHLEVRRGTHSQAREYCIKGGDFVEEGEPPKTAEDGGEMEKQRFQRAWDLAKQGRYEEIDADIRVRHYNTLKNIRKDYQVAPPPVNELINEWYWGETGAGKSRKAREENPHAYLKNANKWWDGYVDQEVVIIDEWSPDHHVLASHLKQWADHHPFAAETKGGMICIRPKKIIITSNFSPEACFEKPEDLEPIRRRFKITHFTRM